MTVTTNAKEVIHAPYTHRNSAIILRTNRSGGHRQASQRRLCLASGSTRVHRSYCSPTRLLNKNRNSSRRNLRRVSQPVESRSQSKSRPDGKPQLHPGCPAAHSTYRSTGHRSCPSVSLDSCGTGQSRCSRRRKPDRQGSAITRTAQSFDQISLLTNSKLAYLPRR
jgi:hypothetical protein